MPEADDHDIGWALSMTKNRQFAFADAVIRSLDEKSIRLEPIQAGAKDTGQRKPVRSASVRQGFGNGLADVPVVKFDLKSGSKC